MNNKSKRMFIAGALLNCIFTPAFAVPLTGGLPHDEPLTVRPTCYGGGPKCLLDIDVAGHDSRYAFDQNGATTWYAMEAVYSVGCDAFCSWQFYGYDTTGILGYRPTKPTVVYLYSIAASPAAGTAPKSWTFEGYDASTGWHVLDTINNYSAWSALPSDFPISNTTAYSDYRMRITSNAGGTSLQLAELILQGKPLLQPHFDFDGNGKAEMAIYRPTTGAWIMTPPDPRIRTAAPPILGVYGDVPVPADYNGDGHTDVAIWHPANGAWSYIADPFNQSSVVTNLGTWGATGDIPMPGDYDGDGKADLVVWRPSTGQWLELLSTKNYAVGQTVIRKLGTSADVPVSGDFDGDGKTDLATYNYANRQFTWLTYTNEISAFTFSAASSAAIPVPGDYDGDGLTDVAVWEPSTGTWMIRNTSTHQVSTISWGGANAGTPVPADYDGDGITDLAFWNAATRTYHIRYSKTGAEATFSQGVAGDIPVPSMLIH